MSSGRKMIRNGLLGATALAGLMCPLAVNAAARAYEFHQAAQPLGSALRAYSETAEQQIIFTDTLVAGRSAPSLEGSYTADDSLRVLLAGAGLEVTRTPAGVIRLVPAADPQGAGAGGGAETNVVQELVVTAQKREEAIQTVPIAISAFTQKSLEEQKIEGGFDLLKAIPNVTFSKNNFTSYNFSIRGIGTKAVSATTDPGVAVAFNNTALLQNRLFEQEYFDVERVEVLRGPQGTLYGRNATAGVINVISAKPDLTEFSGSVKAEVGNYNSRRASGFINVPILNDKLAVRLAGSFTQREGYDFNSGTNHRVNGRDLWSGRLTVGFKPFERLHGNFVWEHFNEDDNRSRTGKQLCHHDAGPDKIGSSPIIENNTVYGRLLIPALFSTGCKAGSLYNADAFGTPNGLALPFVFGMLVLGAADPGGYALFPLGYDKPADRPYNERAPTTLIGLTDPYGGMMQSSDLRVINSFRDPVYRAKADVFELNVDFDLTDSLTFTSQTAYNQDQTYSFQDYNRFNTVPLFTDTSQLYDEGPYSKNGRSLWAYLAPGGVFCDPQLGCSKSIAGFDIAQAKGEQFSEEIRLQSSFDAPINFSVGANYTRFKTLVDYYVFYNLITAFAQMPPFGIPFNIGVDPGGSTIYDYNPAKCGVITDNGGSEVVGGVDTGVTPHAACPYIDPNPIESINGDGHNYFRSKNPYKLSSWAAFGEVYWKVTDTVKITAGLRYTDDKKSFIPVPSQILMAPGGIAGGNSNRGYPEKPAIEQQWGEFTGRIGADWKPALSFTDQTMIYAFYSRGYKGGGANPPTPGFATAHETAEQMGISPDDEAFLVAYGFLPILKLTAAEYGATFKPEFVNAFELGTKNTLLGGALTLNTSAFFYDYKDYQVSQIRDRSAVNENFDAKTWGLELETLFSPSRNFRINANLGYLDTEIADGMKSIDIMNRTQGNPDWIVAKPFPQLPSNCVVPTVVAEAWFHKVNRAYFELCGGMGGIIGTATNFDPLIDPNTGLKYDILHYPEANGGAGLYADLGGNELPNAPHWTANIGAQYSYDFLEGWKATLRGDAYWQSQSWARVYNEDPYDKLHGWYNLNLSLWLEKPDIGLKIEIYAKNVLDKSPITDAFLNSDDSALTTNVFVLDPRLIGFSVSKKF